MDSKICFQNYTFPIIMVEFKISVSNKKPFPLLNPGSKSQKCLLQRPFNFEKDELAMSSIEKINVNLKLTNAESFYNPYGFI